MGTRSLTRIMSGPVDGDVLTCIYRQYDGYLSAHGAELRDGFGDFDIVNGLQAGNSKIANGMGCLAAQVISTLKTNPGGIYIYPSDADDEEYGYTIYADGLDHIGVATGSLRVKVTRMDAEIYNGPLSGLPISEPDEDE